MSVYRRAFRYYRPFWGQTTLGLLLTLCAIALNLAKPWPFKVIVDEVLTPDASGSRSVIPLLCGALVAIHLAWGLLNVATNYIFVRTGLRALLRLRT